MTATEMIAQADMLDNAAVLVENGDPAHVRLQIAQEFRDRALSLREQAFKMLTEEGKD